MLDQKFPQFAPAKRQQRTKDSQSTDLPAIFHSRQTDRTGPAQQSKNNRFRLIVRLMREDHALKYLPIDNPPKKLEPDRPIAGRRIFRQSPHSRFDLVPTRNSGGNRKFPGQRRHKTRIIRAGLPTDLMIEMNDMQRNPGPPMQQQQQRDAVSAATDGDGPAAWGNSNRAGNQARIHAAILQKKAPGDCRGLFDDRNRVFSGKSVWFDGGQEEPDPPDRAAKRWQVRAPRPRR